MNYTYGYLIKPRLVGGFNPANEPNTQFYSDPTIASSINAGNPSDTDPVSILGDLAPSGNDGTQPTPINKGAWNTTHVTYATNDFISIDNVMSDIAGTTNFTFSGWIRPVDATPASNQVIFSLGDDSASEFMFGAVTTAGKFRGQMRIAGVNQWIFDSIAVVFSDNVWTHWEMSMDGVECKLYINGALEAVLYTTDTDKTKSIVDATGLDVASIAALSQGGSESSYINADNQQFYISTDVKSAAKRAEFYNHKQP